MTAEIVAVAELAAAPGTQIVGAQPSWGVSSAEGFYDSFISAAGVLDVLSTWSGPVDAVVLAGFGEHGREGARQLLDVPVVDITEAAAYLASLVSHRFGVVTTMRSAVEAIQQSLDTAGIADRCAGIQAAEIPVLQAHRDPAAAADALQPIAQGLIDSGADGIVLGCAGFAGLDVVLQERLGVPVVDGVAAAVTLCEGLVRLGKTTSKLGPYAPPSADKSRPGWPPARIPAGI